MRRQHDCTICLIGSLVKPWFLGIPKAECETGCGNRGIGVRLFPKIANCGNPNSPEGFDRGDLGNRADVSADVVTLRTISNLHPPPPRERSPKPLVIPALSLWGHTANPGAQPGRDTGPDQPARLPENTLDNVTCDKTTIP